MNFLLPVDPASSVQEVLYCSSCRVSFKGARWSVLKRLGG